MTAVIGIPAMSMIWCGLLVLSVGVAHLLVDRRVERDVPTVLRARVALSIRINRVMVVVGSTLTVTGLLVLASGG